MGLFCLSLPFGFAWSPGIFRLLRRRPKSFIDLTTRRILPGMVELRFRLRFFGRPYVYRIMRHVARPYFGRVIGGWASSFPWRRGHQCDETTSCREMGARFVATWYSRGRNTRNDIAAWPKNLGAVDLIRPPSLNPGDFALALYRAKRTAMA